MWRVVGKICSIIWYNETQTVYDMVKSEPRYKY